MDNFVVFVPLLGSGFLLIGSILINVYNRFRPIPPPVPPPPVEIPTPIVPTEPTRPFQNSKSFDDLRSLYLSLRQRHKQADETPESLSI